MSMYHDIKDNYGGKYDHCDFRPRKYKCRVCNKGFKTENAKEDHEKAVHSEIKTSDEWNNKHEFVIIDHDGWDRRNFAVSYYEEKITEKEFLRRASLSTRKITK